MSCSVSPAFAERSLNRAALCADSECSAKDKQCIRLINGTAAVEIRRCKLFLRKSFHAEHIAENEECIPCLNRAAAVYITGNRFGGFAARADNRYGIKQEGHNIRAIAVMPCKVNCLSFICGEIDNACLI